MLDSNCFLNSLFPYSLPVLPLSEKHKLPSCAGVYFVIDISFSQESPVIYIGETVDLKRRWQSQNIWQLLRPRASNLLISWLECKRDKGLLQIIETAFIQSLDPELNQSKESSYVLGSLRYEGWDEKLIPTVKEILYKIDKTDEEKKIFIDVLSVLMSQRQPQPLPKPTNWIPKWKDVVLWTHENQKIPCKIWGLYQLKGKKRKDLFLLQRKEDFVFDEAKVEASIVLRRKDFIFNNPTPTEIRAESKHWGHFYVPLSELQPAQGIGGEIESLRAFINRSQSS